MQNISYVMALMGRDWITGLKPAKNVGKNNAVLIERLIMEVEDIETPSVVGFEIDVREDLKKGGLPKPQGSREPKVTTTSVTQYQRDSSVKAWILNEANGICECCSRPAPFKTAADNLPYLEVHHVRQLAQNGSDTITNAVAICPNCHRALHYSMDAKELTEKLYGKSQG